MLVCSAQMLVLFFINSLQEQMLQQHLMYFLNLNKISLSGLNLKKFKNS